MNIKEDNNYTKMQKRFYDANAEKMAVRDHKEHNENPDYWDILLGDISDDMFEDNNEIKALDFGCGTGRNVFNLLDNWNWRRVDGVDISEKNINEARKKLLNEGFEESGKNDKLNKFKLYTNNGIDLSELNDNEYQFIMSTIVFQHISVYDIRYSLLKELYRVLDTGGMLSIQLGFKANKKYLTVGYYENFYDAPGTNSDCNVRVDDPKEIIKDLESIGFSKITYEIRSSFSDDVHPEWIYVKAIK